MDEGHGFGYDLGVWGGWVWESKGGVKYSVERGDQGVGFQMWPKERGETWSWKK